MRMNRGKPFMDVEADSQPEGWEGKNPPPTFSEAFLYPTVGKGEARFILGVAEEYQHIIDALGPTAIRYILDVKPRLAQRLGLPEVVRECLDDAASDEFLMREERIPSQVILDEETAHAVWEILHTEYKRYFNPEEAMDHPALRAYHTLTDGLGHWEQRERQKEIDRLPEKLEMQARRREEVEARKQGRKDRRQ